MADNLLQRLSWYAYVEPDDSPSFSCYTWNCHSGKITVGWEVADSLETAEAYVRGCSIWGVPYSDGQQIAWHRSLDDGGEIGTIDVLGTDDGILKVFLVKRKDT